MEKAEVNRFTGKMAVLLVLPSATHVAEAADAGLRPARLVRPVVVKRSSLPKGAKVGDWLDVEFKGVRVVSAQLDAEARGRMEARIAEKLERLMKRKEG